MQEIHLPFVLRLSQEQRFYFRIDEDPVTIWFAIMSRTEQEPIAHSVLLISSNKSMNKEGNWPIEAYSRVNDIIRAYQIITGDIFNDGIISPLTWNQFACNNTIYETDKDGKLKENVQILYFSVGLGDEPVNEEKYLAIRGLVESPALLSKHALDEFLIRSKIFMEQHNFRMAVLEAIIALEFALYAIVESSENMPSITNLGISKMLRSLHKYSDTLPSPEVISECLHANLVRNQIMHRAKLAVTAEEAQMALKAVKSFIEHYKVQLESKLGSSIQ